MKTLLLIALMAFSSLTMNAVTYPTDVTINVTTAGTLNTLQPTLLAARIAVVNLTVTGNIDARDIYYLAWAFNAKTYDLSDANLIAYTGVVNGLNKNCPNDCYPNIFSQEILDSDLTKLIIPKSTKIIESNAFNFHYLTVYQRATPLTDFTLPKNITNLGSGIFTHGNNTYNICQLKDLRSEIIDPTKVVFDTNYSPFYVVDTINCILHVPYGTKSLYQNAKHWKGFKNIVEDAEIITTNINTIEATSKISIYPNPCTNSLHINAVGVVEITNMSGAVVKNVDVLENESVDVSDLSKGVYFVKVGESVCKLVKE